MTGSGKGSRAQAPLVLLIIASVAAVAVALSGVAVPTPALRFAQAGHWIAQPGLGLVAHINGATKSVDARAKVADIEPGSQVVQGATSGYVVGSRRIVEFGKSTLSVLRTMTPPTREVPAGIEAAGGPYLVYRQAGRVIRLGEHLATIAAGGALGQPVVTRNGTLWVQRLGSNVFCALPPGANALNCPAFGQHGHAGQLTVVGDRPVFVDAATDEFHLVSDSGLGDPVPVGLDVPASARIAPHDASGRLAILDGPAKRLHFVDTAGLSGKRPRAPVTTNLPDGDYRGPAASGSSVVLVDAARNHVLTFRGGSGQPKITPIPEETGAPRMSQGEDGRVYVDSAQGKHVLVVDGNGAVTNVPVVGGDKTRRQSDGPAKRSQGVPHAPPPERTERPLPPLAHGVPPVPGTGEEHAPPTRAPAPAANPPNPSGLNPPHQPAADTPAAGPETPEPPAAQPVHPRPTPVQPERPKPSPPKPSTPKPRPASPPEPPPSPPPPPPAPPEPVPASPPGMPGSFSVLWDSEGGGALASWDPAPDNGSPITAYHLSWADGSQTYSGSSTSALLPNMGTNGPYQVRLVAENAAGLGTPAVTTTVGYPVGVGSDGCDGEDCQEYSATSPQPAAMPNTTPRPAARRRRESP